MGQGDRRSGRRGCGQDRRGIAFAADRDIAGEDAAAGNPRDDLIGQGPAGGGAFALAQRSKEARPPRPEQLAQLRLVAGIRAGVGGTAVAVCLNIPDAG